MTLPRLPSPFWYKIGKCYNTVIIRTSGGKGVGEVRIGICSWTDKTLLKSGFYPASASSPEGRLTYYSSRFGVVEVDSTYYALADSRSAHRWIGSTPENFLFGIKSYGLFTFHRVKFASLPAWFKAELSGGLSRAAIDTQCDLHVSFTARFSSGTQRR